MKVRWFKIALILCCLLNFNNIYAAETVVLSIDAAADLGILRNRNLINVKNDIDIMKYRIKETKSALYPHFGLQITASRYRMPTLLNEEDFSSFIPPSYVPPTENIYDWEIQMSQLIYSFGKIDSAVKLAELEKSIKRSIYKTESIELSMNIKKIFNTIIYFREYEKIYNDILKTRNMITETVKNRLEAGDAIKLDLLKMESLASEIPPIITEVRSSQRKALRALKLIIAIPEEKQVDISGQLPEKILPINHKLSELKEQALNNRTEINQLVILKDIKSTEKRLNRSNLKPNLVFSSSYGMQASKTQNLKDSRYKDWNATVAFTMPLYDGGEIRNKIAQNNIQIEQISRKVKDLRQNIRKAVEDTVDEINTLYDKQLSVEKYIKTTKEAMRVLLNMYHNGVATYTDYKEVEENYLNAELAELGLRYRYALLLADFNRVMGKK